MQSIPDRARAYVRAMDPAVSGSGGHNATFKAAVALTVGFGLADNDALAILQEEFNPRCNPPWTDAELIHKVRSARLVGKPPPGKSERWLTVSSRGDGVDNERSGPAPAPVRKQEGKRKPFDLDSLRYFAGSCPVEVDRAWLWERSPIPVEWGVRDGLGADFLSWLYQPGECVLVFSSFYSQGDFCFWNNRTFRMGREPGIKAVQSKFPVGGPDGVWFLTNPVSGKWEIMDKGSRVGRRHSACVTSWRYAVLESDEAPARLWVRALVQLPVPVAAIYTSGGKSIHALVRLDASGHLEFDQYRDKLVRVLSKIGADPAAISGVRLSRLPGCYRGSRAQELLYLNPRPKWRRLLDMPKRRNYAKGQ